MHIDFAIQTCSLVDKKFITNIAEVRDATVLTTIDWVSLVSWLSDHIINT
jgi:hypothetical protein